TTFRAVISVKPSPLRAGVREKSFFLLLSFSLNGGLLCWSSFISLVTALPPPNWLPETTAKVEKARKQASSPFSIPKENHRFLSPKSLRSGGKKLAAMGRLFIEDAKGEKVLICRGCRVDSASYDDIESKEFQGRYGRAYLFRKVVNIVIGSSEERILSSGFHVVNDIYCSSCMQLVGWRYL
ncbi:unnamed protein product, partial [Linum tenue]